MAHQPDRRAFLLATAAAVAAALSACDSASRRAATPRTGIGTTGPAEASPIRAVGSTPEPLPPETPVNTVPPNPQTPAVVTAELTPYAAPALTTVPAPAPHGTITALPGGAAGNALALTVDDGIDSAVVAAYIAFVKATGIRLTFFVNGVNPAWTDNAADLRPLVESGQVQLGNHTWSHPDLTKQSSSQIASQLTRNDTFLGSTYGIDARPFYRPPFGHHSTRTDAIAADHGYTTPTMWYGSLGDSAVLTETTLLTQAQLWIRPGAIVIGHANHPTVTHLYPQLVEIIRAHALHTVTLADVYRTS